MNMAERTERMKKFILMNNIVIIIQIVLVVLSVILTLISGLIPSRQAAKKDPVLALRSE